MRLTLFVATSLLAVSVLAAPIPATQKEHKVTPLPKKPVKPVVPAKKPDADKPTSDIILDTESVKMMSKCSAFKIAGSCTDASMLPLHSPGLLAHGQRHGSR